jgi:hypothetical protein
MSRILAATFVSIALTAAQDAAAGERMVDLFRQGYQLVATEPYLSFEGCKFDKAIPIAGRIFKCQTYEYVYHYGKAEGGLVRKRLSQFYHALEKLSLGDSLKSMGYDRIAKLETPLLQTFQWHYISR